MFKSFIALSEYIHELRAARTGRSAGFAMRYGEVWQCAIDCPRNGISEIFLYEKTNLPKPFSGMFVRVSSGETNRGLIYVDANLDDGLKEFAIIKELMHCWSPGPSYIGTSEAAKDLVASHVAAASPYPTSVASDNNAILAAYEVILPSYAVERYLSLGKDSAEIALACDLDERVVKNLCRPDILHQRKNGHL